MSMQVAVELGRAVLKDFEDVYRAEYPSVYRAALLATGDSEAARDATQEAFKRALVRWKRLSREPWVGGWIMTTALNLCRKRTRETPRADMGHEPQPQSVDLTRGPDIEGALRRLPFRQRQVLVLYYLGDVPIGVISDLLGIAEGTVKAHLAQGRATLRRALEVRHV